MFFKNNAFLHVFGRYKLALLVEIRSEPTIMHLVIRQTLCLLVSNEKTTKHGLYLILNRADQAG